MFKKPTNHDELVARFANLGYDGDTLANSLLAVLVGSTVELSLCETTPSLTCFIGLHFVWISVNELGQLLLGRQ